MKSVLAAVFPNILFVTCVGFKCSTVSSCLILTGWFIYLPPNYHQ